MDSQSPTSENFRRGLRHAAIVAFAAAVGGFSYASQTNLAVTNWRAGDLAVMAVTALAMIGLAFTANVRSSR